MKNAHETQIPNELEQLCASVRAFVTDGAYESCMEPICQAMARYPDAPQPHNLLGIVLEKKGDHAAAMKHFRAAWALDPAYRPVNHNMFTYATFYSGGGCAFDESDLPPQPENPAHLVYNDRGVGRIIKNRKTEYERHGFSRAARS